MTVFSIRL